MVLRLRVPAPDNWQHAKCLGQVHKTAEGNLHDPWFNEDDHSAAADFCNGTADGTVCPIRHECLIFSLANNEKSGIWGGTTEKSRKRLRKLFPWRASQPVNPSWHWRTSEEVDRLYKDRFGETAVPDDEDENG